MSKVAVIRIKESGTKGEGSFEYKNQINLNDFKMLAILFSDLSNYGAKIEKAFNEFNKLKEEDKFPF